MHRAAELQHFLAYVGHLAVGRIADDDDLHFACAFDIARPLCFRRTAVEEFVVEVLRNLVVIAAGR